MRVFARPDVWAVLFSCVLFLICVPPCVLAGPSNPDISVIGETRATWSEAADRATIEFEELEIAILGPLNPYASAEVFIGVHGEDGFEVEEAKLLLERYLPGGLGLTVGRYLQDFGQLNQLHSHSYPFVMRPLMHEEFFGEDGVVDAGVRLDWLAPVEPVAVRASLGAVRGDLFLGGQDHGDLPDDDDHRASEELEPELGLTARVDVFAEPSPTVSFLLGASVLRGQHDPVDEAAATWFGADVKARWDLGPGRSVVFAGEAVFGSLESTHEVRGADPNGWFVNVDLRTGPRWNFGGFAESATERGDDSERTHRYGGFLGFALMEESTLFRLVGHVSDPEVGDSETGISIQALFGLGPHRPHRY